MRIGRVSRFSIIEASSSKLLKGQRKLELPRVQLLRSFRIPLAAQKKTKTKQKTTQQQTHTHKTGQKQQNQFVDIIWKHSLGDKVLVQGSRKPPSGCLGQEHFILGQATFDFL